MIESVIENENMSLSVYAMKLEAGAGRKPLAELAQGDNTKKLLSLKMSLWVDARSIQSKVVVARCKIELHIVMDCTYPCDFQMLEAESIVAHPKYLILPYSFDSTLPTHHKDSIMVAL